MYLSRRLDGDVRGTRSKLIATDELIRRRDNSSDSVSRCSHELAEVTEV